MMAPGSNTPGIRTSISFAVSAWFHGCVLAWVILGAATRPQQRAQSMYDQEIRPNEKKIIWYSLRDKLPEISPPDVPPDSRPARARVKAPQILVAGAKDKPTIGPLIWTPEPEVAAPKVRPLPNVVAVAPPRIIRGFVPPPEKSPSRPPLVLLQDAPAVVAANVKATLPLPVAAPSGPRRAFSLPPKSAVQRQAALQLPEAPSVNPVVLSSALPFPNSGPRPPLRTFTAPPKKSRELAVDALPAAPEVAGIAASKGGMEKVPRAYLPSRPPAMPAMAPAISAEPPVASEGALANREVSMVIVGLNPAKTTQVPDPPASRTAGFSAGPLPSDGGTGTNRSPLLNVPGLLVTGGAKDTQPTLMANFSPTSRENLLAATRSAMAVTPKVAVEPRGVRVAEAPDPRLAGRVVYSIAIQMPNVTSFSGSWLVWFAEREPLPGGAVPQMRPPVVVRKVDPKYIAAAVAERVEGTVRLFGVIRKDGHVAEITLIRQLDERLDRSAQEALAKWEFVAARRDGVPVDVDAIFEIPFHLAPRPN